MDQKIDKEALFWLRRTGGTWIVLRSPIPAGAQAAVDAGWLSVRLARGEGVFLDTTPDGRAMLQATEGWPDGRIPVPAPQPPRRPGGRLRPIWSPDAARA